jgi:hypothetical protein
MRCLIDIINRFSPLVSFDIYDVRGNVNYQKSINTIFIFRDGGPGDPLDGSWDTKYYELIDALTKWNLENPVKSMCCLFVILSDGLQTFWFGRNHEKERYFGVMKMHKTVEGQTDSFCDPFTLLTPGITSVQPKLSVLKRKVQNYFIMNVQLWPLDLRIILWEHNFILKQIL